MSSKKKQPSKGINYDAHIKDLERQERALKETINHLKAAKKTDLSAKKKKKPATVTKDKKKKTPISISRGVEKKPKVKRTYKLILE